MWTIALPIRIQLSPNNWNICNFKGSSDPKFLSLPSIRCNGKLFGFMIIKCWCFHSLIITSMIHFSQTEASKALTICHLFNVNFGFFIVSEIQNCFKIEKGVHEPFNHGWSSKWWCRVDCSMKRWYIFFNVNFSLLQKLNSLYLWI